MSEIFCGTSQISHVTYKTLCENTSNLKIFKIQLSSYYNVIPEFITYLNAPEFQRAQKYRFEKDSNQFIICRVLLKFILAQQTGYDIKQINIKVGINKKPYLSSNKTICFNVSHAKDFAIIAVSNYSVGIDLEYLNQHFDFSEILPSVCSALEIESVLNAENKTKEFYKLWTRKEAIVKATGQGISDDLLQIPAMDGNHVVASKLLDGFKTLQVFSFDLDEDYMASLAISSDLLNLEKFKVYNLPSSLEELVLFTNLNRS